MFIIPWGSWLIGATFILRDITQEKYGRKKTYGFIGIALVLSAISSLMLNDPLYIVAASAVSFALSETTDTEIYTRLRLPMHYRVLYSGIVGGALDSAVFVIIGLSPIGAGFLTWEQVPYAILGQIIVKTALQAIGATILRYHNKRKNVCFE